MSRAARKLKKEVQAAGMAGPAPASSSGDSASSGAPAASSADVLADPSECPPHKVVNRLSTVAIIRAGFKKKCKKNKDGTCKKSEDLGKSGKFGINPKAIGQSNAQSAGSPSFAAKVPTHIAGIEIPMALHPHIQSGQPVPYDHPAREAAAKFVTQVWRKDQNEGRRISGKLLGVTEDEGVKPGFATKKIEPGETSQAPAPAQAPPATLNKEEFDGWKHQGSTASHPIHGRIYRNLMGDYEGTHPKAGKLAHHHDLKELKAKMTELSEKKLKKDEAPPKSDAPAAPPAEKPYNPRTERPNQRARVADVKAQMMADPSKTRVSLSTTNSKLAKDGVASFNLVPIETCPGAGSCAKYCYADTGSYLRFHKTTMPPRVANWLASQKEDFVPKMVELIGQHKKKGKIKAIRVHDSGDFYSPQYIDKWTQIAAAHPDMTFYAYTKSHHPKLRERLNELEKLPNFNVVQSFGSKYDHLIDPSKPHCVVFPSKEHMDKAGYADAMETDLTSSDKKNTKIGLYIHGQYDKSYPGLRDHVKANPAVAKEIEEKLGSLDDEPFHGIKKTEKPTLRKLLKKEA